MSAVLKRGWKWFVLVALLPAIPFGTYLLLFSRMNLRFLDLASDSPMAVPSYQFRADPTHLMKLPEGKVYQFDKSYDEMKELIANELKDREGWKVAGDPAFSRLHSGPVNEATDDAPAIVLTPKKDKKGSEVYVYLPPTSFRKKIEGWQGQRPNRDWEVTQYVGP